MRTVSAASVAANDQSVEGLPESVPAALGGLAGAARKGLLAPSVGVGWECRMSRSRPRSTRSSAATSRIARRCATATRAARSRSAGGASR